MRHAGAGERRLLTFETTDGGRRWSRPRKMRLPNPDAAVAGLRLHGSGLLLVFNNNAQDRDNLALAYSGDGGRRWRVIHSFERPAQTPGGRRAEFSYPWILQSPSGDCHVFYTWHRKRIKHVRFNQAWLRQKL